MLPCRGVAAMPVGPWACSCASCHAWEGVAPGSVSVPRALCVPLTPGAGGTGPGSQGQGPSPAASPVDFGMLCGGKGRRGGGAAP